MALVSQQEEAKNLRKIVQISELDLKETLRHGLVTLSQITILKEKSIVSGVLVTFMSILNPIHIWMLLLGLDLRPPLFTFDVFNMIRTSSPTSLCSVDPFSH